MRYTGFHVAVLCLLAACSPAPPSIDAQTTDAATSSPTGVDQGARDERGHPRPAATASADFARFGGWRRVHSAYDGQPQYEELYFVMLATAISRPMKFAMVDESGAKLRCCLAVTGVPLDAATLKSEFNLPGPWITDLTNGWNESSTFRPVVYRAIPELLVVPEEGGRPGGLLVEAGPDLMARVGGISVAGVDYEVRQGIETLPDGDGAMENFTVLEKRSPHRKIDIEVPYGTY